MTGGGVTFIFQIHVISAWFLFALWPFTRLVHAWSLPIDYMRRSPIVYRSRERRGRPARGGTPIQTGSPVDPPTPRTRV
jgi:nitrate reductase gamma subunit